MLCEGLLSHFSQFNRLLNLEYRLSQGHPLPQENPFPAALIDAVSGYNYLVNNLGFTASNILVVGESAGGTLALQLVRYVVMVGLTRLPPPGGLLLLSPSMDWGDSLDDPTPSASRNQTTDWVQAFAAGYTGRALRGRLSSSDANLNLWTWPATNLLLGRKELAAKFPHTLILGGDAEMTLDAMRTAQERMAVAVGEEKAIFVELKDATHITLSLLWHAKEKEKGYQLLGPWINTYF